MTDHGRQETPGFDQTWIFLGVSFFFLFFFYILCSFFFFTPDLDQMDLDMTRRRHYSLDLEGERLEPICRAPAK